MVGLFEVVWEVRGVAVDWVEGEVGADGADGAVAVEKFAKFEK